MAHSGLWFPCLLLLVGALGGGQQPGEETTFLVHWTHVPKAAGTSFLRPLKRIACEANPHLREWNPCCLQELCLGVSCYTSVSGCPLITGVGRHTSNMAMVRIELLQLLLVSGVGPCVCVR